MSVRPETEKAEAGFRACLQGFFSVTKGKFSSPALCEGALAFGGPFPPVFSSPESGAGGQQLSNAAQTLVFSQVLPLNPSPERKDIFFVWFLGTFFIFQLGWFRKRGLVSGSSVLYPAVL